MVSQTQDNLQVSVEETEAWGRKLVVTVPAQRVKNERARIAKGISRRVKLPGFRKGKVPPRHLESRYGAAIDRETVEQLIDKTFREAVDDAGLEPISKPKIANVRYDPDEDLTFEVAFDIWPEITLQRVGGFRVTRRPVQVSAEEIDEELERLRQRHALWKKASRQPRTGDNVSVEITPLDADAGDGEPKSYRFILGEGQAIPEVEEAITTLEPGTTGEFEVSFPADFPDEARRGTTQRLKIALDEVMEPELPPLDDEFAASVGDFESLEALRDAIVEGRRERKARESELELEHNLVDQVIQANAFVVPESMVDRYLEAMVGGPEEIDESRLEEARREARPAALWGIKRMLVLRRIAKEHDLEASPEDVKNRIAEIAERTDQSEREIRAKLARSGELEELERRITEENVFRFLKERSEIETEDE